MGILIAIITAAGAYLLGAIDTGIIVSRLVYHDDVRNHGSGAAGMTNMLRTFGKKAAAMTACGDVFKGFVAVRLAMWLFGVCGLPALWGGYLAAVLAVSDGVSEDTVYQTVSAVFENAAELARQYPKGSELDLEFAASMTSAPYHPGAARYFAEKGITVPAK